MPESLVVAPWFGDAVAIALTIIGLRVLVTFIRQVEDRIRVRRATAYPLPSHVREQVAANAREHRPR